VKSVSFYYIPFFWRKNFDLQAISFTVATTVYISYTHVPNCHVLVNSHTHTHTHTHTHSPHSRLCPVLLANLCCNFYWKCYTNS